MDVRAHRLSSRQRHFRFLATMLVCNLHVVRNLPGVGNIYLAAWALVAVVASADYVAHGIQKRRAGSFHVRVVTVWVLIGVTGLTASLFEISATGSLYGLARFWFALPIFMALCAYVATREDLDAYIKYCVTFFTIAVLTIPLQVAIGPIQWFHDSTERGGLVRYPSMLGGLNSAGGAVGAYMLLASRVPGKWRWFVVATMALCVALDLSKSGMVSIGAALVCLAYLHRNQWRHILLGYFAVATCAAMAYALIPTVATRIGTTLLSFGIVTDTSLRNSDKMVLESGTDRLTSLPQHNLDVWQSLHFDAVGSWLTTLMGGGFGMASTALVPSGDSIAPMSHNQWVEILTVFGLVGLALLGTLFLSALWRLGANNVSLDIPRSFRQMMLLALLLILARYAFANGGLYHPATATPMFLCLFAAAFGPLRDQPPRQPARGSRAVKAFTTQRIGRK